MKKLHFQWVFCENYRKPKFLESHLIFINRLEVLNHNA